MSGLDQLNRLPSSTQPDCLHITFLLVPNAAVSRTHNLVSDL